MNAIIVHQKSIAELGEMFGENQKIEKCSAAKKNIFNKNPGEISIEAKLKNKKQRSLINI